MFAALVGFGAFFLALLLIGIIGYWKADPLEAWIKRMISADRHRSDH
jgi:hypothetical protein